MQHSNYQSGSMYQPPAPNKRSAGMETAAFVLGIVSLATCACIYTSVVCGALAIMFASLSKGGATSMSNRARYALILGLIGLIATIIMYTTTFAYAIHTYGSIENLLKEYCNLTGMDFNELYGDLFAQ